MEKKFKLSVERLEALKEELKYLKTVREREVKSDLKEARSFGDLSENSEYDEARKEQGKLYSRISEVENILANYELYGADEDEQDESAASAAETENQGNGTAAEEQERKVKKIRLGSKIRVLDLEFDEESDYEIVGSQEADPMGGRISEDSPFGKALLGKAEGEEVIVEAPAGLIRYKVVEILKKN